MVKTSNQPSRTGGGGNAGGGDRSQAMQQPTEDIVAYLREYVRENPESAAMWCFGIGFVLGWKLKPW